MSQEGDEQEVAQLKALNADLARSLSNCRALLKDCKSKLAANSNELDDTGGLVRLTSSRDEAS